MLARQRSVASSPPAEKANPPGRCSSAADRARGRQWVSSESQRTYPPAAGGERPQGVEFRGGARQVVVAAARLPAKKGEEAQERRAQRAGGFHASPEEVVMLANFRRAIQVAFEHRSGAADDGQPLIPRSLTDHSQVRGGQIAERPSEHAAQFKAPQPVPSGECDHRRQFLRDFVRDESERVGVGDHGSRRSRADFRPSRPHPPARGKLFEFHRHTMDQPSLVRQRKYRRGNGEHECDVPTDVVVDKLADYDREFDCLSVHGWINLTDASKSKN